MTAPLKPSECHPDLTEDRLTLLADFFANVCSEVALLHDSGAGDDGWSLGCRRNARWRHRLAKKAQSGEWPWFTVVRSGKRFVFSVGSVPVRFYRGKHTRPNPNTLTYDAPELQQLAIAFKGIESPYKDLKYRFAIETGLLGEPAAVVFAGLAREDGAVVCSQKLAFTIKLNERDIAKTQSDMRQIPAPVVFSRKESEQGGVGDAS